VKPREFFCVSEFACPRRGTNTCTANTSFEHETIPFGVRNARKSDSAAGLKACTTPGATSGRLEGLHYIWSYVGQAQKPALDLELDGAEG
jgi:hypothetical protein